MTMLILLTAVVVGVLAAVWIIGWTPSIILVALIALAVFPRDVGSLQLGGVQASLPNLAMLLIAFVAVLALRKQTFPVRFLPLLAVVALVLWAQVWSGTPAQWAGLTNLALVVAAWFAGTYLASLNRGDPNIERWLAVSIFLIIGFEAAVTILQTAGVNLFPTYDRTSELTAGRANGSLGHPGSLGKALLFLNLIALPLTRSADKVTKRLAGATVVVTLIPIGLSASRANFAAMLVLVVLWALLLPRQKKIGARVALPAMALIVALMFSDTIAARFQEDPEGGAREHLMDVALAHVGENFWFGVGPNTYIEYFGQFDQLTSQGWRVHNVFALQLAEIGLVGAALLFVPLFLPYLTAVRRLRLTDSRGMYARALLVSAPVVLIMGTTGWGLASGAMFYLWFFTIGYLVRRMTTKDDEVWTPDPASTIADVRRSRTGVRRVDHPGAVRRPALR